MQEKRLSDCPTNKRDTLEHTKKLVAFLLLGASHCSTVSPADDLLRGLLTRRESFVEPVGRMAPRDWAGRAVVMCFAATREVPRGPSSSGSDDRQHEEEAHPHCILRCASAPRTLCTCLGQWSREIRRPRATPSEPLRQEIEHGPIRLGQSENLQALGKG